jgi:PKD repeat protein
VIDHDECYRFDTLDVTLTVNEVPQPTFTVDPSNGCVPHSPTFTNTIVGDMTGATLTWDFGNGNSLTGSSPVTTIYDVVDCYDVTLEITTATGC